MNKGGNKMITKEQILERLNSNMVNEETKVRLALEYITQHHNAQVEGDTLYIKIKNVIKDRDSYYSTDDKCIDIQNLIREHYNTHTPSTPTEEKQNTYGNTFVIHTAYGKDIKCPICGEEDYIIGGSYYGLLHYTCGHNRHNFIVPNRKRGE